MQKNSLQDSTDGSSPENLKISNPLLSSLGASLTNGLTSSLSGSLMAMNMKDMKSLRDELRVCKKQEQLTKEKLSDAKKSLDQSEESFKKYKLDAEQRLESIRAENNMLQLTIKHLNEKNEIIEKTSKDSSESPDVLRLIDDYSRSNELKSKEIQDLLNQASEKKAKHQILKRVSSEQEQKLLRLQSNLENLKKFSRIFIKSMQKQNQALKTTVVSYQKDFSSVLEKTKSSIEEQIVTKLLSLKSQYDNKIQGERQHVLRLEKQLEKRDQEFQEAISQLQFNTQASAQVTQLTTKNDKLRAKISNLNKSLTDADSDTTSHKVDVLQLQLESEQQKYSMQLQERDRNIKLLQQQIEGMLSRENSLSLKLDQSDLKARQEYQRMIEVYEGSSRYKELRDLYEDKLQARESLQMETKNQLIKLQVRMEYMAQKEQELALTIRYKEESIDKNHREFETSSEAMQQTYQKNLAEKSTKHTTATELLKSQHEKALADLKMALEDTVKNLRSQHEAEIISLRYSNDSEKVRMENHFQGRLEEVFSYKQMMRDAQVKLDERDLLSQELAEAKKKISSLESKIATLQELDVVQGSLIADYQISKITEAEQFKRQTEQMKKSYEEQLEGLRSKNAVGAGRSFGVQTNSCQMVVGECQSEEVREEVPPSAMMRMPTGKLNGVYSLEEEESLPVVESLSKITQARKEFQPDLAPKHLVKPGPIQVRPNAPRMPRIPLGQKPQTIPEQVPKQPQIQKPFIPQLPFSSQPEESKIEVETEPVIKQPELTPRVEETPRTSIAPSIKKPDIVEKQQEKPQTPKQELVESKIEEPKNKPKVQPLTAPPIETGGIFSMVSNFIGLITRRKQAYQGKPSSAMYYDEKKKRYIIDGEGESDDDVPPPPPPKAKQQEEQVVLPQAAEIKPAEPTGLNSLTQPGFSGALANRNRSRGPRQTTTPKVISTLVIPPVETIVEQPLEQMDETFVTVVNESLDMTAVTANLNQTRIEVDHDREEEWNLKFIQQTEKIAQMRYQNQLLQDELRKEKTSSQQTITELESFSKVMSSEGQSLQQHINDLNGKLSQQTDQLAMLDLRRWQAEDSLQMSEQELLVTRQTISSLKQKVFSLELRDQMQALAAISDQSLKGSEVTQNELDEINERCETLLWRLSAEEAKSNGLVSISERQKMDLQMSQRELQACKTDAQTQHHRHLEQVKAIERDRDLQIKEAIHKSSAERERVLDQMRKGINERDQKIKKQETKHAVDQADFQMKIHEQQHSWQSRLNDLAQRSEQEIKTLKEVMARQGEQIKAQQKHESSRVKTHLKSLEEVLSKKDMDLQQVLGKHDEAQQELQSMSEMRQKLNEHIMYLQNEIRKRDELLENTSDFEEDDDSNSLVDESMCSGQGRAATSSVANEHAPLGLRKRKNAFQKQLEESRTQLRLLVESKLKLQKENQDLASQVQRLQCGFEDLCLMLDGSNPIALQSDQQKPWSQNILPFLLQQDIVHCTIQRFFTQRGAHEAEVLGLTHKLDILSLQCEDSDNLRFDIDLLTEERDQIQEELLQAYQTIKDLETTQKRESQNQIEDLQRQLTYQVNNSEDLQQKSGFQLASLRETLQSKEDEHAKSSQTLNQKVQSYQSLCSNLQQNCQNLQVEQDQILAQVKALQLRIGELAHNKQRQDAQIEELVLENQNMEQKASDDLRLQSELHAQIQNQEEQLAMKQKQVEQMESKMNMMGSECDDIAQAFLRKKEAYKDQIKQLKASQKDHNEATALRAQVHEAESLIQQMQTATEQIVKRLEDKRRVKEAEFKEKVTRMTELHQQQRDEIVSLTNTIEQQKNQSTGTKHAEIQQLESYVRQLKQDQVISQEELQRQIGQLKQMSVDEKSVSEKEIQRLSLLVQGRQADSKSLDREVDSRIQSIQHELQSSLASYLNLQNQLKEKDSQLQQSEALVQQMQAETEAIVNRLQEKREAKEAKLNKKIADLIQLAQQQAESSLASHLDLQNQLKEKDSQLQQSDAIVQQMQAETEAIVNRLKEKREAKEAKLNRKIADLTQQTQQQVVELQRLQSDIDTIRKSSDKSEVMTQLQGQNQQLRERIKGMEENFENQQSRLEQLSEIQLELDGKNTQVEELRRQIQRFKQQAANQLSINQETMERERKELADQLGAQLKIAQDLQEQLEKASAELRSESALEVLQGEIQQLKGQLKEESARYESMEAEYQQESQNLALVFKEKRDKDKEKQNQLKTDFKSLLQNCQQLESTLKDVTVNRDQILKQLQELQREKLELSQSLDITRVQTHNDISKYETERNMLQSANGQHYDSLKACLAKFYDCEVKDFEELLETMDSFLSNYTEDKNSLTVLISEKDEMREEIESLMYKMQILSQERDQLVQTMKLSGSGKLQGRLKMLEEERSELRNDFVIKFDELSSEVSILKSKLAIYEPGESLKQVTPQKDQSTSYKLDQDLKPANKSKPGYFASFFLTDTELGEV